MKLTIDEQADALYLSLADSATTESEQVAPGIVVDYDAVGRVVGIEVLQLSMRVPGIDPTQLHYETVRAAV
jgi:uncharacterized protein YuzE